MSAIATLDGVVQSYRGKSPVLDGIDLEVANKVVGLLGPNGAGKTTLLKTLATVLPPRAGKVTICGESVVSEGSARSVRRHIGYLPQDFGYFPGFSAIDFVMYAAWLRGVAERDARESATAAIDAVGLADKRNVKLKALSGGMVRRVGIASAIVGDPRLLLLDEPTVGLDPAQRLDFRALLRNLRPEQGVVLSTHLVEDVAATCDVVAVIAHGRIGFIGTPEELAGSATAAALGDSTLERGYMSVLDRLAA